MVSQLSCIVYSRQAKALRQSKFVLKKPPGTLIKPKTDKARGRPRLPTVVFRFLQRILMKIYQLLIMIAQRNCKKFWKTKKLIMSNSIK
jgi:hypothetical protein